MTDGGVAFHPARLSGWGMAVGGPAQVVRPTTRQQVSAAMAWVAGQRGSLGLRGAGCSYGDVSLNSAGHVLDTSGMDRILRFDGERGVVTRRARCDHPRPLAPLHPLRLVAAGRAGNDGRVDRRRDRAQYPRQEQLRRRQFRRACRIVRASDRDRRGAALFARRAQRRVSCRDRRLWHARLLPRDHHAAETRACRTAARLGHADARPGAQPRVARAASRRGGLPGRVDRSLRSRQWARPRPHASGRPTRARRGSRGHSACSIRRNRTCRRECSASCRMAGSGRACG